MIWAVLGSGPSLTQEDADYVRGKCKVVAVSDTYKLAPWADILVSHDRKWWRHHRDAFKFKGKKLCRFDLQGTEKFNPSRLPEGSNSGLMGMYAAQDIGQASKIILLGFDMNGTHFFGKHPKPLVNTTDNRFKIHIRQFKTWKGCEVINCTPGSKLEVFPMADLRAVI